MSYVEKHLMTNEKIIYQTNLSWTTYLKDVFILLVGFILLSQDGYLGELFIIVGILSVGITFLRIKTSEFAVTDKRVLIKVGLLTTKSLETMLNKVEGIHVEQGLIGKMSNSGSVIIKGTGGTNNSFPNITNPFVFRNAVNEQISNFNPI